ncbi:hypothetical protein C5167_002792, partial [Papaver somniferum]
RVKKNPRERKRRGLEDGFSGIGLHPKKNKKQQGGEVIDLEAIKYIDPTPSQPKPLKRAESLKIWGKRSEAEQKILQEFCEDATEGEMAYSGPNNEFHIQKKFTQNILDDLYIDSDIVDFYTSILKWKMENAPDNVYNKHSYVQLAMASGDENAIETSLATDYVRANY